MERGALGLLVGRDSEMLSPMASELNRPPVCPGREWRRILPTVLVFLGLSVGSAAFLLNCPPLWRDYDGLIQIATRPSDMTLLQYPAAYPAFSRLHIYLAQFCQRGFPSKKAPLNLRKSVPLNDAGLLALLLSQQLALALALTYFVLIGAEGWPASALVIALLLSNPAIFLAAQLISTEALSQSLLVLFCALSLDLLRRARPAPWQWLAYTGALFTLILTRHANAVFGGLAPLAFLARAAHGRWAGGRWVSAPWRSAALLSVLGLLAIQGAEWTTRGLCRVFEVTYRETGARGPSEKLGFVEAMPTGERAAFVAGLQAHARDPVVREAIPLLARNASWDKQRGEIEKILVRDNPELSRETVAVQADAALRMVVQEYYRTGNVYLLRESWQNVVRALAATPTQLADYYLEVAAASIDLYPSEPWMLKLTRGLRACSPEAKGRIRAFQRVLWFQLWNWLPQGVVLLASSASALLLLARKIGDPARLLFALALTVIAVVATVLTFVFVHFELRFTSTANLLGFLALGLVVATFVESRTQAQPLPRKDSNLD